MIVRHNHPLGKFYENHLSWAIIAYRHVRPYSRWGALKDSLCIFSQTFRNPKAFA